MQHGVKIGLGSRNSGYYMRIRPALGPNVKIGLLKDYLVSTSSTLKGKMKLLETITQVSPILGMKYYIIAQIAQIHYLKGVTVRFL
jgi:hypothetical protein